MKIDCPHELNDLSATRYVNDIYRARLESDLILNFSTLNFVSPSGALILALGIRDIVKERLKSKLDTQALGARKKSGAVSYLGHFGFFHFIGIGIGNKPNEVTGGRNFLPITTIDINEFDNNKIAIQEQITTRSYELAKLIYPKSADVSRVDMLAFCLREVIRNVFEHAGTERCHVMAQKWANGYAEISIADEGIGIPKSLSKSHSFTNSKAALQLAIQPGITRNTAPVNDDAWQNSGFGLYVVSEVGNENGRFSLVSDKTMLVKEDGQSTWLPTAVNGTIVNLKANTNDSEYFPNILQLIVSKGEEAAETIPGAVKTGSKGSKMIDPIKW